MSTTASLSPTARSTIRRGAKRARHNRADLYALLDSCVICHLGIVHDGAPVVLPTGYGRDGDTLYLHGSSGAASLMGAARGAPISVAVTRVDGVVYARSVVHHSMNYASAVVHGTARPVTSTDEKLLGLQMITEHIAPGSWDAARSPTHKELAKTSVLAISLHEASVKLRSGPPGDDEDDVRHRSTWAGVLPIRQTWGQPEPCPLLPPGTPTPRRITDRPALAT